MVAGPPASAFTRLERAILSLVVRLQQTSALSTYNNPICRHQRAMAHSEKAIIDGIYAAIKSLHSADPETLTVRNVRNKAEADLGIEAGLLSNESWKDKSKKIIKDYASELADATEAPETPAPKPKVVKKAAPAPKKVTAPIKKATKRAAPEPKARATKRQKKDDTPSEDETSELSEVTPTEESEVESEFGDSEDSDAPKKKKKKKGPKAKGKGKAAAPARRQSKSKAKADSESEDISEEESEAELSIEDSDDSEAPKKKSKVKPKSRTPVKHQSKSKAKVVDSDGSEEEVDSDASAPKKKATPKKATPRKVNKAVVESDAESEDGKEPAPKSVPTPKDNPRAADSDAEDKDKPASKPDAGSDSEMSIVLDPTPKPKRQRPPKGEKKAKASKEPKAKAASKAKSTADLSPDEVQIKTLQSQLGKCGMKKIWQFELKQYGDDSKAKIRHLQTILKDIGMTGRYSDARAREIKEMRELQADLEAVKEGEKAWGLDSGRRSRSAAMKKSLKEPSDEDDEESGEEGASKKRKSRSASKENGSDADDQPPVRKRRVNPELAFLGSESDSDD
ncbi:hypothetical protein ONS95_014082 [Cadophora gregata]|uniref:uncharacterized protein n=1 Tax=Cadophora gregata TaxID=51156 RepID=UPI0026DBA69C|nr:uncharacterized protein ONS95_014082 [Cadophora gregata]KAK0114596.1 hypothetical protein ONS95_014082 [Cadophora gregata]